MKKVLLILLVAIVLISSTVVASGDVHDWYISTWIEDMKEDLEAWNKPTIMAYIRAMIKEGMITEKDIREEFGISTSESEGGGDEDTDVMAPEPTDEYASLEILDHYGFALVKAGGSIYSLDTQYDKLEEYFYHVLRKDNEIVYTFNTDESVDIVQINSTVYVATLTGVYRYDGDGVLTLLTDSVPGFIWRMTTNGKDLYVVCDDKPYMDGAYMEADYYKISTSGEVTKVFGPTVPAGYYYNNFSVNSDGDRLVRLPYNGDGTRVRNISTGREYIQKSFEAFDFEEEDYGVNAVLYYNNCLLANVKGSLVYYDEVNERNIIMGDMVGTRWDFESYFSQGSQVPVESGVGTDVRLGFVSSWAIGDDGYIYGVTMKDFDHNYAFKLAIPDKIKEVTTYKKTR